MSTLATVLASLVLAAADPAVGPPAAGPATIELEGAPLSVAAFAGADGSVEVLLARGRDVERFRLEGRTLSRTGSFRAPTRGVRPLRLDAAPAPPGAAARVAAVFGEDFLSVDQGTDTALHAYLLTTTADGGLAALDGDRRAWIRFAEGGPYLQPRGAHALFEGPVRALSGEGLVAAGPPVPWAGRGLLEATPLPGGAEALAFEGGRPIVVARDGGARVRGSGITADLGAIRVPTLSVRLEQPVAGLGNDRFGREFDRTYPVPRRVAAAGGALYTISRERSKGLPLMGRTAGQDAVIRLDWKDGTLSLSRPYPGVDAFVLDFAVVERPGGAPLALLLANDAEDGSGRAYLVVQEPR